MPDDANARLTAALAGHSSVEGVLDAGGRPPVYRAGDLKREGSVPLDRGASAARRR